MIIDDVPSELSRTPAAWNLGMVWHDVTFISIRLYGQLNIYPQCD